MWPRTDRRSKKETGCMYVSSAAGWLPPQAQAQPPSRARAAGSPLLLFVSHRGRGGGRYGSTHFATGQLS
ncbi:hypothetical protein CGRA01v4_05032 [Colletotrichum graminicola]|nr:hypothetical protein CGRA01v4_05032 [Colletotrichum graminicola]